MMLFSYIIGFIASAAFLSFLGLVLAALKFFAEYLLELFHDEKYVELTVIAVVSIMLAYGTSVLGPVIYNNNHQTSKEISK